MTKSASAATPAPAPTESKPLKLPDLTIEGFRGFERFHFPKLARVNLLVGPNNSGKTTVLEAVEILADSSPGVLSRGPQRRGETNSISENPTNAELDYQHLFRRRASGPVRPFKLSAKADKTYFRCTLEVSSQDKSDDLWWSFRVEDDRFPAPYGQRIDKLGWSLHFQGPTDTDRVTEHRHQRELVTVSGLCTAPGSLRKLWEEIALEPEESLALEALRLLDPRVEQLAFKGNRASVRLEGEQRSVPLASCGDGMSRVLELGIKLATSENGVLLIDEIDTGLYYRTLPQVWKLVIETARRLDVQVFATTHSRDCVEALAELDLGPDCDPSEVLVHRIDPGATEAVTYDLSRLSRAIEHDIEVR